MTLLNKPFFVNAVTSTILCTGIIAMPALAAVDTNDAIKAKYNETCAACHKSGSIGAQKTGNISQWSAALKKGMPTLIKHVKEGYKNMPARGLCNDCSDADYEALIKYMAK